MVILLIGTLLSSCSLPRIFSFGEGEDKSLNLAQTVILAVVPNPPAEGESIQLAVVDVVTGLPYNQETHTLNAMTEGRYGTMFDVRVGSLLTYVFYRVRADGTSVLEVGMDGQPVRYRMAQINQPGIIEETIAGWSDALPNRLDAGVINGQVVTADLGFPVPDILVSAGGAQTVTDGQGRFTLYPAAPGKHNLVAIAMDGAYQPIQNQAVVAADKTTPALLEMEPSAFREVTFQLQVPADTIKGAPIRIAGNLTQLGNTFTELGGGMSVDPHLMPVLTKVNDRIFSITMMLPAGIDIRYKYTLGDGFWNAEHGLDNEFITHQLIIPSKSESITVSDRVASWSSSSTAPIWFQATVPTETPPEEAISIQFNIAEWLPALPMFKINENTWAFPLISPHNFTGGVPYRYCRNSPCTGDSQAGIEHLPQPRAITTDFSETYLQKDTVEIWSYLADSRDLDLTFTDPPVRAADFLAGLGLTPYYTPSWRSYFSSVVEDASQTYNHLMLSPAMVAANPGAPDLFQASLVSTPRWADLESQIMIASQAGISVSIFPQVTFSNNHLDWWADLPTGQEVTWKRWFEGYRALVLQYASLAQQTSADTIILGGEWLNPALPISDHVDRFSLPGNVEFLWSETISQVREQYGGQIAWMATAELIEDPPAFLSELNLLYLQLDIAVDPALSPTGKAGVVGEYLDEVVEPFAEDFELPVVIVLAVPSVQGFGNECIPSPNDEGICIDVYALKQGPSIENPAATDLLFKAEYYYAVLLAISERDWVDGLVTQGYFPTLALQDASASIHGKPAEDILENWLALVLE